MNSDWPLRKLGDITCSLNARRVPVSSLERQTRQGAYRYYGASGVVDYIDDFIFDGTYLLVSEDGENLRTRNTPIAFKVSGKYWVNNHAHILDETEPGIIDFLEHAFRHLDISAYITGAVQPKLNKRSLEQIELRVPKLEERYKVNNLLGSLDNKIELNRRMNETLEEMARALFRDWFIDFGPTRRQMDGATDPAAIMGHAFPNDKAPALAPLFPARLGENGLPDGWEYRPLSSVVEQQKQVVKPDQHINETFEHFSLPAFDKAKWPTLELGAEIKSNKTVIPSNAILVSKLNPRIERIWIPKDVGNHCQICSTEFLCFKPINGFGLATVEALFRSDGMHEKMASMVTGTSNSHQRVPPKVLMQAEVLLPANIARLFENVASSFLEKRQVNRKENQTLSEIRDLLLPKLMSGEIRLQDGKTQK